MATLYSLIRNRVVIKLALTIHLPWRQTDNWRFCFEGQMALSSIHCKYVTSVLQLPTHTTGQIYLHAGYTSWLPTVDRFLTIDPRNTESKLNLSILDRKPATRFVNNEWPQVVKMAQHGYTLVSFPLKRKKLTHTKETENRARWDCCGIKIGPSLLRIGNMACFPVHSSKRKLTKKRFIFSFSKLKGTYEDFKSPLVSLSPWSIGTCLTWI